MRLTIELLGYRLEIHPIAVRGNGDAATYERAPDTTAGQIELDGGDDAGELRAAPLRPPPPFGLR